MSSDKNNKILSNHLKILGQKIRINILKHLNQSEIPLSYTNLQKKVIKNNLNSTNFTFHLKALKEINVIDSSEDGYIITPLGTKILENIISIEYILNSQTNVKMVRTSKYSKEPFDDKKIEKFLIEEGELETYLAKKIAREVKERLSNLNIEYLTSPLIREYINAVLLENGLEEVRHKLTRLGSPPFEVFKLFNSEQVNPEHFINKLGSDVSEQFLLLNLLPKNLADLYLSEDIFLIDLNYWALRPLGIYLNSNTILKLLFRNNIIPEKINHFNDAFDIILEFFKFLSTYKPYFSGNVVLGDFIDIFIKSFAHLGESLFKKLISSFISQLLYFNQNFSGFKKHITLEFCDGIKNETFGNNSEIIKTTRIFFDTLRNYSPHSNLNPLILFDYSMLKESNIESIFIDNLDVNLIKNDLIFYNKNSNNLIDNFNVNVLNHMDNGDLYSNIILDKILINLESISRGAHQDDNLFFEILEERLENVFELYYYKKSFLKKKLNLSKEWTQFISKIGFLNEKNWLNLSIKSISFYNLNQAILSHCGIELDRLESSEKFALKIMNIINTKIKEKNEIDNENYILNQPHNLINDSKIIRNDAQLSLKRKISLFKKFENQIQGGTVFNSIFNLEDISLKEHLKILSNSDLNAFTIK